MASSLPLSPGRSKDAINRQTHFAAIVSLLSSEWDLGLDAKADFSPNKNRKTVREECVRKMNFLFYKDKESLDGAKMQFQSEAKILYQDWQSTPRVERGELLQAPRGAKRLTASEKDHLLQRLNEILSPSYEKTKQGLDRTPLSSKRASKSDLDDTPVPYKLSLKAGETKRLSDNSFADLPPKNKKARPDTPPSRSLNSMPPPPEKGGSSTRQISANASFTSIDSDVPRVFSSASFGDSRLVNTQETAPDKTQFQTQESKAQFTTPQEDKTKSSDCRSSSFEAGVAEESFEAQRGTPTTARDIQEELSQGIGDCAIDHDDGSKLNDDGSQLRSLQSSFLKAFPQLPASLRSLPIPVIYEVMRVFLHTGVSMSELKIPASLDFKNYDRLWQFLKAHQTLQGKVFPERCGKDVWAASWGEYLCGTRGVVLSGSLRRSTDDSSLIQFRLAPMELDRQHRLGRRLGNDRFLEIDMYEFQFTGKHIPTVIGEERRATVVEWLFNRNHFLFGRTWKPFFVKQLRLEKQKKNRKRIGGLPEDGEKYYYRVYFFAVDGPGFADCADRIPPLEAKNFKFDIPRLLDLIRPTHENETESFLKLFSRISLALSRNTATVLLEQSQIREKEDLQDLTFGPTKAIMTDGAGRISLALALKISAQLELGYLPGGYQGRIGPAKGFWTVDFADRTGEEWIETYRSQRKWNHSTEENGVSDDPSHRTFEVVAFSTPLKSADLIPQFIPILMNRAVNKKQMRTTISNLLEQSLAEELKSLKSAMDSQQLFRKWVYENMPGTSERLNLGAVPYRAGLPASVGEGLNAMLDASFDPNNLLFMKEMARTVFGFKCNELKKRFNITVGESANVFMVPDFLGVLGPNEVYINFSKFTDKVSGVDGAFLQHGDEVLLARTPAHLPSDIQKMKFVVKAEYFNLRDVIVCPIKGSASLASKLSGGDYDGDRAWITWDSSIVDNFTNADVLKPRNFVDEGYIHKDERTYRQLVKGQANPESLFLKESFTFVMRPTLLGWCTDYKEMLRETVLQVDSKEAIYLSTLLSDLVDQAKSGYTFEEEDWTRFKKEVIKKMPIHGNKRKDLEGSMKNHLIEVVHRLTEESRADLHKSIDDPPSWDEDLVLLYKWAEDKALRNDEWKTILSQLDEELETLKSRWSAYWANKPKRDPDDDTRPEFSPILDECFEKYSAIQPQINTSGTELLLLDCLRNPELSLWSMLKASALFASYGPKNGYGTKSVPTKFPWRMAGKQLMRLKAAFREGGGFPHSIVPEMYAMLKPDASFVKRLRVENRDDLIVEEMGFESGDEDEAERLELADDDIYDF